MPMRVSPVLQWSTEIDQARGRRNTKASMPYPISRPGALNYHSSEHESRGRSHRVGDHSRFAPTIAN